MILAALTVRPLSELRMLSDGSGRRLARKRKDCERVHSSSSIYPTNTDAAANVRRSRARASLLETSALEPILPIVLCMMKRSSIDILLLAGWRWHATYPCHAISVELLSRRSCCVSTMHSGTTGTLMGRAGDIPVLLGTVPMPAPASTEPFVIADEGRTILVYRIAPTELTRYGLLVQREEPFCVVRFDGAVFQSLGPPNDEELVQHVLHRKGLRPYGAYEVLESSLVVEWWPNLAPAIALRHFIFTFEDSSFECVASSCQFAGVFAAADIARGEAFLRLR